MSEDYDYGFKMGQIAYTEHATDQHKAIIRFGMVLRLWPVRLRQEKRRDGRMSDVERRNNDVIPNKVADEFKARMHKGEFKGGNLWLVAKMVAIRTLELDSIERAKDVCQPTDKDA